MTKPAASPRQQADAIRRGERAVLARVITLAESNRPSDREHAQQVLDHLLPLSHEPVRVGITGAAGAGKSSLIEKLGLWLTQTGHRVAVLAIDPTSPVSGGSILGDKTRMTHLARAENAFVRPSPSGHWSSGVGAATGMAVALSEAAGFDVVLIETVGVGQAETAITNLADFIMLLVLPGGGDSLQGIKRGLGETADLIIVTQADGDKEEAAKATAAAYSDALAIMTPPSAIWRPQALPFSAMKGEGLADLWAVVEAHQRALVKAGVWESRRAARRTAWMHVLLRLYLAEHIAGDARLREYEDSIRAGRISPERAAQELAAHLRSR